MPEMTTIERLFCQSAPWRALTSKVILPRGLQGVEPGPDVLEIGCGSGAMAAGVLERFPDARITATDYDPKMVEKAQGRLARFGDRARVERADATKLPYDDESFDTVLSFTMLHHVRDWEPAIGEVARVLRPGGVLVGFDLAASTPARWLHVVQRETHRLVSPHELERRFTELEFDDVRVKPAMRGLAMRFRVRKRAA